jgi:hypothetical protein
METPNIPIVSILDNPEATRCFGYFTGSLGNAERAYNMLRTAINRSQGDIGGGVFKTMPTTVLLDLYVPKNLPHYKQYIALIQEAVRH